MSPRRRARLSSDCSTSTSTPGRAPGGIAGPGLIDLVFNGLDSPWAVEILRGVEEWGTEHSTAVAVSAVRHGNARPASWTSGLASTITTG